MDDQVRLTVKGRGVAVYQHYIVAAEVADKSRRGVNRQARARDYQQVCLHYRVQRAGYDAVVKSFLIEDNVGLDNAAALARRDTVGLLDEFRGVELAALASVVAQYAAVQLIDPFAACRLVQTVNVLGDYRAELARLFELGEF